MNKPSSFLTLLDLWDIELVKNCLIKLVAIPKAAIAKWFSTKNKL